VLILRRPSFSQRDEIARWVENVRRPLLDLATPKGLMESGLDA